VCAPLLMQFQNCTLACTSQRQKLSLVPLQQVHRNVADRNRFTARGFHPIFDCVIVLLQKDFLLRLGKARPARVAGLSGVRPIYSQRLPTI
jgi:hypothetical protein